MQNFQQKHFDDLARTQRPTRRLFSCGFKERYGGRLLEENQDLYRQYRDLFHSFLSGGSSLLLDVGGGTGFYLPSALELAEKVCVLDLSREMLQAGACSLLPKHLGRLFFLQSCTSQLPFREQSITHIIAFDTLHHIGDLEASVNEIARVLTPGGRFLVVEPNLFNPFIFAAHVFPPEERGALRPKVFWGLEPLLRRSFRSVSRRYLNMTIAKQGKISGAVCRWVEGLLKFFNLKFLYFRVVYEVQK